MAKTDGIYFRGIKNPREILEMIQEDTDYEKESQCNELYSMYSLKVYPISISNTKVHPALSDEYWKNFEKPSCNMLMELEYAVYVSEKVFRYSLN